MSVESKVTNAIRVGRFIRAQGFIPANWHGRPLIKMADERTVGILKTIVLEKKGLGKLFPKKPKEKYLFIGKIEFTSDTKWMYEVYGTSNQERAHTLATGLSEEFGVDITVALMDEYPKISRETVSYRVLV